MKIIPDLNKDVWNFSCSEISVQQTEALCSKSDLSTSQQKILDDIVENNFKIMGNQLGCTHLVEFEIHRFSSDKTKLLPSIPYSSETY